MALNTATSNKADKKPTQDAKDIDNDEGGTDLDSMSSIGEKNISDMDQGGGDGSFAGDAPNTFIDPREAKQSEKDEIEADKPKTL